VPAAPANNLQQFEQQYGRRFQQVYRSELHLMRIACKPTHEQFDRISAGGEPELRAVIKKCAEIWCEQRQLGVREESQYPELSKAIAAAVVKAAKAVLPVEQVTLYQKELDRRDAARRRVVLSNLVTAVDQKLVLSAEQRDRLREILDNNWRSSWNRTQVLMSYAEYIPPLPDDKILPILSEAQKVAWRGLPKSNAYWGFELDLVESVESSDEVWP
jgi:hypothetical protein